LNLTGVGFDDFNNPSSDCQTIFGRVFTWQTEEEKQLKEFNAGLINLDSNSRTGCFRVKLNLTQVKSCCIFEGQVIAVRGFYDDDSKFRAHEIIYPRPAKEDLFKGSVLKACSSEKMNNKHA